MFGSFVGFRALRAPIGSPVWRSCHAGQRNQSTSPLKGHYELPSGDKIPAIALGAFQIHSVSIFNFGQGCNCLKGWRVSVSVLSCNMHAVLARYSIVIGPGLPAPVTTVMFFRVGSTRPIPTSR